jgi:hypothetical protein
MNDGTAALPSIEFDIDAGKDTGFYRVVEDSIGITAGGEVIATITRASGTASSYVPTQIVHSNYKKSTLLMILFYPMLLVLDTFISKVKRLMING